MSPKAIIITKSKSMANTLDTPYWTSWRVDTFPLIAWLVRCIQIEYTETLLADDGLLFFFALRVLPIDSPVRRLLIVIWVVSWRW